MDDSKFRIENLEKELTYLRFEKQKFAVKANSLHEEIKYIKKRGRIYLFLFLVTLAFLSVEIFFYESGELKISDIFKKNNKETFTLIEKQKLLKEIDSLKNISNINKRRYNVYRVQIGAFNNLNEEKSLNYKVEGFYIIPDNSGISLSVGGFDDKTQAIEFCKMLRRRGIFDAFVVYDDGKTVNMVRYEGYKHFSY